MTDATAPGADPRAREFSAARLRERRGAVETASLISGWFADSTELDLVDLRVDEVGDRLHIAYRFEGVEEGELYLVEQHLFGTVRDGIIDRADQPAVRALSVGTLGELGGSTESSVLMVLRGRRSGGGQEQVRGLRP